MGLTSSIIETGVDKLVRLVNTHGRISSQDAAKEIGVSSTVVMEWVDFLEEEGIIQVEYKFAKPFLVARKISKKDVKEKAKEFSGKREVFVRKAEVSLSFLNREAGKLNTLKKEFDKIKQGLGMDINSIKTELAELEKYEQLKINLDKQIENQKVSAMDKLEGMTKQILMERKKYQDILNNIELEEEELKKDKEVAKSIEKSEKKIKNKLSSLREFIGKVESKIETEEENVSISENNIQKQILKAERTKLRIQKEKGLIDPLVEKSKNQVEVIKGLQDKIIKKIVAKEERLNGVKKASKEMKQLFKRKLGVLDVIEKVNKDRSALQKELIDLIKKAKSFQLSSKSADVGTEMASMEKKFKEVDNKKKAFEKELTSLSSSFK